MAEKQDYPFQVNFKPGEKPLINVRANNADEFSTLLNQLADLAGQIASVNKVLANGGVTQQQAIATVQQNLGGQVIQDDTPPWEQQAPQVPQQRQYQQPPQQQTYQQGPPAPSCQHGPMQYREGNKNGKDWKAYFCPSRDRNNQCKAQWVS